MSSPAGRIRWQEVTGLPCRPVSGARQTSNLAPLTFFTLATSRKTAEPAASVLVNVLLTAVACNAPAILMDHHCLRDEDDFPQKG